MRRYVNLTCIGYTLFLIQLNGSLVQQETGIFAFFVEFMNSKIKI